MSPLVPMCASFAVIFNAPDAPDTESTKFWILPSTLMSPAFIVPVLLAVPVYLKSFIFNIPFTSSINDESAPPTMTVPKSVEFAVMLSIFFAVIPVAVTVPICSSICNPPLAVTVPRLRSILLSVVPFMPNNALSFTIRPPTLTLPADWIVNVPDVCSAYNWPLPPWLASPIMA